MSANKSPFTVQLPTDEELVLKVIPMPADSNANGDILSFFAKLTRIGRTLITVKIEVFAERFGSQAEYT